MLNGPKDVTYLGGMCIGIDIQLGRHMKMAVKFALVQVDCQGGINVYS